MRLPFFATDPAAAQQLGHKTVQSGLTVALGLAALFGMGGRQVTQPGSVKISAARPIVQAKTTIMPRTGNAFGALDAAHIRQQMTMDARALLTALPHADPVVAPMPPATANAAPAVIPLPPRKPVALNLPVPTPQPAIQQPEMRSAPTVRPLPTAPPADQFYPTPPSVASREGGSPYLHPSSKGPVVIGKDVGGWLAEYETLTDYYRKTNREVKIHECHSACTTALSLPNVCVYPNSIFKFHQAYDPKTQIRDVAQSSQLFAYYPPAVQARLTEMGGLEPQYKTITGRSLIAMGIRQCDSTMVAAHNRPSRNPKTGTGGVVATDSASLLKSFASALIPN